MANTRILPIYNATRAFIVDYAKVYERIKNLHKHRVGAFVYDKSLELVSCIVRANRYEAGSKERVSALQDYLDLLDEIVCGLRVAKDIQAIDEKASARLSEKIVQLTKQSKGWKNHTEASVSEFTDSGRDA